MSEKRFIEFSDFELLSLIKSDILGAFEELYKRYWKILYSSAFKRVKNNEIAEEIVQDVFVNIWKSRRTIDITSEIKNYMLRSVTYQVIDFFRKDILRNKYIKFSEKGKSLNINSTEQIINLKDTKNSIASIVNDLPDKCRSVYELSRNEFKTNKEIAELLGVSEKTIENHITKALKRIRQGLKIIIFLLAIHRF
jgi:RNA polymerase sigma-70 factor (family 1)